MWDKLPVEVLLEILRIFIATFKCDCNRCVPPLIIASIDSRSRKAAISDGGLWSNISINWITTGRINLAELFFLRSRNHSLQVVVGIGQAESFNHRRINELLHLLRRFGGAVSNLDLHVEPVEETADISSAILFALNTDNLEELSITSLDERPVDFVAVHLPLLLKLRSLTTWGVTPFGPLPATLNFLSIEDDHLLGWPENHLADLILQVPNLTEFRFSDVVPYRSWSPRKILFPKLERLVVGAASTSAGGFLCCIEAPSLMEVEFAGVHDDLAEPEPAAAVADIKPIHSVQRLILRSSKFPSRNRLPMFFPSVTRLEIPVEARWMLETWSPSGVVADSLMAMIQDIEGFEDDLEADAGDEMTAWPHLSDLVIFSDHQRLGKTVSEDLILDLVHFTSFRTTEINDEDLVGPLTIDIKPKLVVKSQKTIKYIKDVMSHVEGLKVGSKVIKSLPVVTK